MFCLLIDSPLSLDSALLRCSSTYNKLQQPLRKKPELPVKDLPFHQPGGDAINADSHSFEALRPASSPCGLKLPCRIPKIAQYPLVEFDKVAAIAMAPIGEWFR